MHTHHNGAVHAHRAGISEAAHELGKATQSISLISSFV